MSSRKILTQLRTFYKTAVKNRGASGSSIGVYDAIFSKYLIVTNTATCGVLMAVGDMLQQEIEYRRNMIEKRYDWGRMGRMFLIGFSLGPAHHFFYKYMDHYLPRKNLLAVIKKILLDQLVMSPFCIAWFFYGMGILEKKTLAECTEELNSKFVEVYTIDWSVWPPAQFLNFYFLKVQYQVIYINFITMFYNVFLSYVKHREVAEDYKRSHFRLH